MPELKQRPGDQPLPVRNDHPDIQSLVLADIAQRRQVGIDRYGTALQPHNGRDALRDLYEELLDGVMYARQLIEERTALADSPEWLRVEEGLLRGELAAQDATFGEQNHPDGTGGAYRDSAGSIVGPNLAWRFRKECHDAAQAGTLTWRHILTEEVYEALAEDAPDRLAAELLQVAAVAIQWRRSIARRRTLAETPQGASAGA
ncbi:hypothetical protein [Nonomuraea sp. NPDC003214]